MTKIKPTPEQIKKFNLVSQVDNKIKYERARNSINETLRNFTDDVICYDYSAKDAIKKTRYNKNSAFDMLKLSLSDLAEHFQYY